MKQLIKTLAIAICIVVFTACNGNAANLNESTQSNDIPEQYNSENSQTELSPLELAKEKNSDTVAWLFIPNTAIDNQVMQTTTNDDYLKKNENGEYDIWGCYFADYYSNLTSRDSLTQNTVIYGHSESSENPEGKRFTQLFKFLDMEFLRENPTLYLTIDDGEILTFEIFAVFFTDIDFYYIDPNPSSQGFEDFMETINQKNEYIFENISVTQADKLLTLSVCSYRYDTANTGNHRLVIIARLLPQESEKTESSIVISQNAIRPI